MALDPDPILPAAPAPDPEMRARAIAAAMARFDRVHPSRQGSADLPRPRERNASSRRPVMVRTRLAIAAAAVAVVAAPITWKLALEREVSAPRPSSQDQAKQDQARRDQARQEPAKQEPAKQEPAKGKSEQEPARTTEAVPPAARQQSDPAADRGPPSPEPPALESQTAERKAPPPVSLPVGSGPGTAPARSAEVRKQPARSVSEGARREALAAAPPPPAPRPLAIGESAGIVSAPSPRTRRLGLAAEHPDQPAEPAGRDSFAETPEDGFRTTREAPVSTFSIDVDTASYGFLRASLNRNLLPPKAAVRTEELINYFPYAYDGPASAAEPFKVTTAVFPSPWAPGRRIVHVGIKGYAVAPATRPRANLVFLIDTSGSMGAANRLPLVKQSLAMLLTQLDARDRVAIVTYAGHAGIALEPTPASEAARILGVIEGLEAGGGTAGGEGIRQAYALAERNIDAEGVNRVVLATDGDFNLGITDRDELKGFVERERGKGIFLSVLGFGMGNYNDALMQALAQNGNGAAAHIDTLNEARKVLVEEATSTLIPIAKDVKIQVEFNPATVAEYRLIGYETRRLAREDFSNDAVDAGDVGSGQTVTALYEVVPAGGPRTTSDLRYGARSAAPGEGAREAGEYAHVGIRYKLPKSGASALIEASVDRGREQAGFEQAPQEARFATAVAAFGQILRGGRYTGGFGFDDVVRIGAAARGEDAFGYRAEFLQLVRAAKTAQSLAPLRP